MKVSLSLKIIESFIWISSEICKIRSFWMLELFYIILLKNTINFHTLVAKILNCNPTTAELIFFVGFLAVVGCLLEDRCRCSVWSGGPRPTRCVYVCVRVPSVSLECALLRLDLCRGRWPPAETSVDYAFPFAGPTPLFRVVRRPLDARPAVNDVDGVARYPGLNWDDLTEHFAELVLASNRRRAVK